MLVFFLCDQAKLFIDGLLDMSRGTFREADCLAFFYQSFEIFPGAQTIRN